MSKQFRKIFLCSLGLLLLPAVAYADVVWPALYLETRMFSWWAISIGFVVEFFFVRWLFSLAFRRALIATFSANLVSTIAGILLIPLGGIAWELFPGLVYNRALGWGTFNPVTWAATFLIASVINALIEGSIYKLAFKYDLKFKSRKFLWLVLANGISVGVAFASLWVAPIRS